MGLFEAAATVVDVVADTLQAGGSVIADTVEDGVDVAVDGLDQMANKIDQVTEGNPITPVVGGVITGVLHFVRDVVGGISAVVRDVFDFIGSILRLDFLGAVQAIVHGFIHVFGLGLIVVRAELHFQGCSKLLAVPPDRNVIVRHTLTYRSRSVNAPFHHPLYFRLHSRGCSLVGEVSCRCAEK